MKHRLELRLMDGDDVVVARDVDISGESPASVALAIAAAAAAMLPHVLEPKPAAKKP